MVEKSRYYAFRGAGRYGKFGVLIYTELTIKLGVLFGVLLYLAGKSWGCYSTPSTPISGAPGIIIYWIMAVRFDDISSRAIMKCAEAWHARQTGKSTLKHLVAQINRYLCIEILPHNEIKLSGQ